MRSFSLYRYRIPLQSGLILRHQPQDWRSGLICHLTENEKSGWGEIAPLIGFSRETLSQAEQQTFTYLHKWQNRHPFNFSELSPSVAFGLSMAMHELQYSKFTARNVSTIPLCSDSSRLTIERIAQQNRYLAKLKVGRLSPEQDGENVRTLLTTLPELHLRLDANQAWDLDTATTFAKTLSEQQKKRIQFIEEPCHTPEQSLQFAKNQHIHIAWDETIQNPFFQLQPQEWLTAIVLKPTLIGSIEKCLHVITQAKQLGLQTIISSSLESSLGLSQLAGFASQYTPQTPAGLDTLALMQHQLVRPFPYSNLPLLDIDNPYCHKINQ